jgi:murein DD-endopeptidase MepM/ murein hydrolase activator NlpD
MWKLSLVICSFFFLYSCLDEPDASAILPSENTSTHPREYKPYLSVNKLLLAKNIGSKDLNILQDLRRDFLPVMRVGKNTGNKELENYTYFFSAEYEKLILYYYKNKYQIDKSYALVNSVNYALHNRNFYAYKTLSMAFIHQAIEQGDERFDDLNLFAPFSFPSNSLKYADEKRTTNNEKGGVSLKYKLNTDAAIYRLRGKLPWPVDNGTVITFFGEKPHPFIHKIKILNNGIAIKSKAGSVARCVFDGQVSKIISIPGANSAVLVAHDDYFSLYSNLKTVFVQTGDKVKGRQKIGEVYSEKNSSVLQFQLWYKDMKLNPAQWLVRKD